MKSLKLVLGMAFLFLVLAGKTIEGDVGHLKSSVHNTEAPESNHKSKDPILPIPENLTGESSNNKVFLFWDAPLPEAQIFFDHFESYSPGDFIALNSPFWTTWTGQPGSSEDATASQEQAFSPLQSMKFVNGNDMVYPTGNVESGKHLFNMKMFFPSNNSGWLIFIQNYEVNAWEWGGQAKFQADGTGYLDAGGAAAASFTFNHNSWLNVSSFINVDDDLAEFWLNDNLIHSWQWSTGPAGTGNLNQLGAMNFFQPDQSQFFVDDFEHGLVLTLTGFTILRDGTFLDFTTETAYTDNNPTALQHEYCVIAVFEEGESEQVCVLVDILTGVSEMDNSMPHIFPNPASDLLNISSDKPIQKVNIMNIYGVLLYSSEKHSGNEIRIALKDFSPGVYFVQIEMENETILKKFLIR
jgi:hypothetical protein